MRLLLLEGAVGGAPKGDHRVSFGAVRLDVDRRRFIVSRHASSSVAWL
jgi:hypothetical protein